VSARSRRITVQQQERSISVVVGPIRDAKRGSLGSSSQRRVAVAVVTGGSVVRHLAERAPGSLADVILVAAISAAFVAMLAFLSVDVLWRLSGNEEGARTGSRDSSHLVAAGHPISVG
jgi:hypothetical protein